MRRSRTKIKSPRGLLLKLAALRRGKKKQPKIVFTNGCFDLLHAGHVSYLERARALGDLLVVALNSDDSVRRLKGSSRPINALADRMCVLASLECVDFVTHFDQDTPQSIIEQLCPDVLVKGGDYSLDQIVGAEFVRSRGGKVKVISFVEGKSTTAVITRMTSRGC